MPHVSPPPPSLASLKERLAVVQKELNGLFEKLKQGQDINLTVLNLEIQDITLGLQKIPVAEAQTLKPDFVRLMGDVDRLYAYTKEQHADVTRRLTELNQNAQASSVYQKKPV